MPEGSPAVGRTLEQCTLENIVVTALVRGGKRELNPPHYLVHAFEAPLEDMMISSGVPEESIEQYRICARREAHTEMSRFIEAAGLAGDPPAQVIEHGYAPGVLVDKARELAADLVVVGKHGRSRTEQLLLGSVTLHLLAECDCDVLVVQ